MERSERDDSFKSSDLSEGEHTITLTVTDPAGQSGQSNVSITVGNDGVPTTTTTIENASTTTTTGNTGPAGTLDTTFGTNGKVTTDIGSADNYACALGLQADGKIVVVGDSSSGFALARYNTNGTLDTTFGKGGIVTTVVERGNDIAFALAIQPNGKIVVTGQSAIGGIYQFAVVRYNTNGTLDTEFGTGGIVKTQVARMIPPVLSASSRTAEYRHCRLHDHRRSV